jgi:hypothetical protein
MQGASQLSDKLKSAKQVVLISFIAEKSLIE